MQSTRTLPEGYHSAGTIDIKQNVALMIGLNIAGLVVLVLAGGLFFSAAMRLHPGETGRFQWEISSLSSMLIIFGEIIGLSALNIVVHEAAHGIFFWLFTRTRPVFALRLTHAYAAAPDWYLSRGAYLVTCLAPLVLISLGGLACMALLGPAWLVPVWFLMTINAGGATGDIAVACWLLFQPATCLANDRGDAVTLYTLRK